MAAVAAIRFHGEIQQQEDGYRQPDVLTGATVTLVSGATMELEQQEALAVQRWVHRQGLPDDSYGPRATN